MKEEQCRTRESGGQIKSQQEVLEEDTIDKFYLLKKMNEEEFLKPSVSSEKKQSIIKILMLYFSKSPPSLYCTISEVY